MRTVIFDMKSPSDMQSIAEPLFKQVAQVAFSPVMNLEDLKQWSSAHSILSDGGLAPRTEQPAKAYQAHSTPRR